MFVEKLLNGCMWCFLDSRWVILTRALYVTAWELRWPHVRMWEGFWMISLIIFLWCWILYRLLDQALHLSGNTWLIDQLLPVSYWLNYAEKWWSLVGQTCCKGAARDRNHEPHHHMGTLLFITHTGPHLRSLGIISSHMLLFSFGLCHFLRVTFFSVEF